VRLIEFPMPLFLRSREHSDGLLREFRLISLSDPHNIDVPHRLIELADQLGQIYGSFGAPAERTLAEAEASEAASVDLVYRIPAHVGTAAARLGELMDEADRFCAAGRHLLTLVAPPELRAFRRWFLEEFTRQVAGEPPVPWPAWRAAHPHPAPVGEAPSPGGPGSPGEERPPSG
jgi:hypothetical protein